MFKRMSVLVRRPSDSREQFAEGWQRHGGFVRALPFIRSYIQNHVVEEFLADGVTPVVRADGLVELRFDTPDDMGKAFSSDAAVPVKADEPNFLGHGTGYGMVEASPIRTAEDGSKIIVAIPSRQIADTIERAARSQPGLVEMLRDDVASVIARPEMKEGPQAVATFLHLFFDEVATARRAGAALQKQFEEDTLAVYRVRTMTFI
jgi:uncharacterized protein (TIGR02118 family)